MGDAIRSAVSLVLEKFDAHIKSLQPASPLSSSTSTFDVEKMHRDLNQLILMLDAIRIRLDVAEEREIRDDLDHYWLRELKGVAYDAEDVLDGFLYEATSLQLTEDGGLTPGGHMENTITMDAEEANLSRKTKEMRKKALQVPYPSCPAPSHQFFACLHDVEQRIEEINSRFDEIRKCRRTLWFDESCGQRRVVTPVSQPTSSLIEEPYIHGRQRDLEIVKKFLFSDAGSSGISVPVMAIVGMGGLGKTTLAQLAYNDDAVIKHFPLKSWVCVSEDFNLVQLTREMFESFNREACGSSVLDPLQVKLKEKLAGQRFLLVLDDVWEAQNLSSNWDRFTAPLRSGSVGSKIIVTTRSEKVSKMTRAILTHRLPCLQDEDCLNLFNGRAFQGRDLALHPNLVAIGIEIAKRCKGLPLVAKTLGGLLYSVEDEEKWSNILDSDIWNINEENEIMPVLRLSYQHLPAHLKRCFRFCSVFPKDYLLDKDRLVCMWMAHGYIKAKEGKLMESIGKEYFDDLLSRSFFQCSQSSEKFLMHDLIHDLARFVSEGECYSMEGNKPCSIQQYARHFSIVSTSASSWSIKPLNPKYESETLRSFLVISSSSPALGYLFTEMKHLRVVDLRDTQLDELPNSIGCLKHLRYLGLRHTLIKQLPNSVGSLYNLQTLDLYSCYFLKSIPHTILNLLNLRHLIYEHCIAYPTGIRKLVHLQSLPGFCVSQQCDRAKLGELKGINNIGSLVIIDINNLTDVDEAKKACLERKECLLALDLRWNYFAIPSPIDDEVLESLKPCPQLEQLKIYSFLGLSLPSWLGDRSFSKLTSVELSSCRNWTSLPPLGQLPSLKWLSIWAVKQVGYIGHEFFSGGFPRLETLRLGNMHSWKSWCGARHGEFPHLRELFIANCKRLVSLSLFNLDALQVLDVTKCPQLWMSNEDQLSLSALRVLNLNGCAKMKSLPLSNINALECLRIHKCPQLRFSYEYRLSSSLQVLSIRGSPFLTGWAQKQRQRLPHIQSVEIEDKHLVLRNVSGAHEATDLCLRTMPRLHMLELVWDCNAGHGSLGDTEPEEVLENLRPHNNLNKLVIRGYIGSRFAAWLGDPSFSNLVSVALLDCSQCKLLPPLGLLPHLTELCIQGAHRLRCIGKEFFEKNDSNGDRRAFPSLRNLEFGDMRSWEEWVEMKDGYLPYLCELILKHCPVLRALPRLPPTLRELEVANCDVITLPPSFDHLSSLLALRISGLPVLQRLPNLPLGLMKLTIQGLPALVDLVTPVPPPSLRDLVLEGCSKNMVAKSLPHLTHLTNLHISDIPDLATLPLNNLVILQGLRICDCPELASFECFSFFEATGEYIEGLQSLKSLERLSISHCPKLHLSANERPPFTLKSMYITNCPSLAPWHDKHWRNRAEINQRRRGN